MNGSLVLGLACIDSTFRDKLFDRGLAAALEGLPLPLTWAESEGLADAFGPTNPLAPDLRVAMERVGSLIYASPCRRPPCPWPSGYTTDAVRWPPAPPPDPQA